MRDQYISHQGPLNTSHRECGTAMRSSCRRYQNKSNSKKSWELSEYIHHRPGLGERCCAHIARFSIHITDLLHEKGDILKTDMIFFLSNTSRCILLRIDDWTSRKFRRCHRNKAHPYSSITVICMSREYQKRNALRIRSRSHSE